MMKALVLDFDGVISDSAPESFVVALRTYLELRPESRLERLARELEGASAATVRRHPDYLAFLESMPLGNRAEDFGVLLWLLDNGFDVADQPAYDRARAAQSREFLDGFHERFYHERRRLTGGHLEYWLSLLGPYPSFVELLRRRSNDVVLALATAKDRESVALLLRAYGIEGLFPEDRVLDKETGVSKVAHLSVLAERLGLDFGEITFVDDKVNHLDAVSRLGVRCGLAAWGYNGARERDQARERGHLVCELDDFEAQLFR